MRSWAVLVAGFALALPLLSLNSVDAQQQMSAMPAIAAAPDQPTLSVLTYNVEGLPFPLAMGRGKAADEIADRLKGLRSIGQQPHVVVLQEAFGDAQRAIGAKAGYRYSAEGPDRDLASAEPADDADRAFARDARLFKGERSGKWTGSGLIILSDYPILSVRRAAFPATACAGFDCLANKGVLMATVRVPGVAVPIAVIATHMNSKQASGVPRARFNAAFDRQVRSIGSFLRANLAPQTPYVFAGDTNIGKSAIRRAEFEAMLASLPRAGGSSPVKSVLATCLGANAACAMAAPDEVRKAYTHGKDWQVYAAGSATDIRPLAIGVPFGHDSAGAMLSDHIGYTAVYRLEEAEPASIEPVAALR